MNTYSDLRNFMISIYSCNELNDETKAILLKAACCNFVATEITNQFNNYIGKLEKKLRKN